MLWPNPKTPRNLKVAILELTTGNHGFSGLPSQSRPKAAERDIQAAMSALHGLTVDADRNVRDMARSLLKSPRQSSVPWAEVALQAAREGCTSVWDCLRGPESLMTAAWEGLGGSGSSKAVDSVDVSKDVPVLINGLKDSDEEVRTVAAYALAELSDKLPRSEDQPDEKRHDPGEIEARNAICNSRPGRSMPCFRS